MRLTLVSGGCLAGSHKSQRLSTGVWSGQRHSRGLPFRLKPRDQREPALGEVGAAAGSSSAAQPAAFMEDLYDDLAAHALQLAKEGRGGGAGGKVLIGVAGGPGSGKSTLAKEVVKRINAAAGSEVAVVVPMDGFHYYKRQLQQFKDPAAAFARRGAHWTFDAEAFVGCLRRIREDGRALVPSFDHGVGDPVEGDICVTPGHQIVVSEGNYLLLDIEPWAQLADVFDETVFVDCDIDVAMQRVFLRQTGHGVAPDVSRGRIAGNDRPNAELIVGTRGRASRVVPSLPFRDAVSDASASDTD